MILITEVLANLINDSELAVYSPNDADGDIYIETMPDVEKEYFVSIYQYGGRRRELSSFGDTRHYSIQINVKNRIKNNALKKLTKIIDAINFKEYTYENDYLFDITATQEPYILQVDKDGKYIASVNITVSCNINN